ncbi:uncharacterized protein LOC116419516 [Sarcophilus harrisii]|uniref:uncharacterized protein LOC116419516 n=1 Tax=Sarcophilus harrisii TaxID=9305 RepID=UPI00130204F2|nr:uncharacterized protein LOC116419516 [Sarcophilus harrisii]
MPCKGPPGQSQQPGKPSQGPPWAKPTARGAPQGPTWAKPTDREAPQGPTWAKPTDREAPQGPTWAKPTDREAPQGPTWAKPTDREAPQGPTWVNPIDWKASEDPILVNAAICGISQGPIKADGNVSTCPREGTGVFLREEEHRFRQKVPQTAVTKSPLYCQIRFPMRKGSLVTIFSLTESGLFKTGEDLCVCEKFLMGTCQNDSSCLCYHTLLPFHWQFHHKYDNCWYSVPIGTQMHLEMIYANPNYKAAKIVYLGKIFYLDMNLRIFQSSSHSCFDYVRRICCKSDSPLAPPSEVYYHSNYKWIPYDQENENPSSNLQTPNGTKRKLTATQLKEMYIVKIMKIRRMYNLGMGYRNWHIDFLKQLVDQFGRGVKNLQTLQPLLLEAIPKENGYEYDACVNDMNTPTLFTVFRRELTYPYFIIFYKCVEDPVHLVY